MARLAILDLIGMAIEHRRLLVATTRVEFQRRYAGSMLGLFWTAINPLLFLGVYLFLFLVVFKMRLPEYAGLGYAVMIFCGLVPYLCFMETVSSSATILRSNIHLVKNVIMPVDLIPLRAVLVALTTQGFGLAAVLILAAIQGELAPKALYLLPIALLLQAIFLIGIALFLSALGVLIPDLTHILGTLLLFLMFISPIAFNASMVPPGLEGVMVANPIAHMIETFRAALMDTAPVRLQAFATFGVIALLTCLGGAAFFRRFKSAIVDYE